MALRREIRARGVRAPYDRCEVIERRILDVEDSSDRIERTAIVYMSEFSAFDVIRSRALVRRNCEDFGGGNVNELRKRVDETADQPGASDAIDFRVLASDP